jgi:hypothetical protein
MIIFFIFIDLKFIFLIVINELFEGKRKFLKRKVITKGVIFLNFIINKYFIDYRLLYLLCHLFTNYLVTAEIY